MCKIAQEVGIQKTQRTRANVDRVGTDGVSAVSFGSADKVMGICWEEKT
jgi:hypothetical protein